VLTLISMMLAAAASGGGLSREEIVRGIDMPAIQRCYDVVLAQRFVEGRLTLFFRIGGDGKVIDARIDGDTLGDEGLKGCILGEARAWTFDEPKGGGIVNVTYPFVFSSSSPPPASVSGGLSATTVMGVVDAAADRFDPCMTLRPNRSAFARITAVFTIDRQGHVTEVTTRDSTLGSTSADICIRDVVKTIAFPAAPDGRPTSVTRPLTFVPPDPPPAKQEKPPATSSKCMLWPF